MNAKSVGLFVDVSNLYYCIEHQFNGRRLNYRKYLSRAVGENELFGAFAYGAQLNNEAEPFIRSLIEFGYTPKWRRPKQFSSGVKKANWDLGIAMDVVRMIDKMDIVIIGSGDGDYAPLVEWVREQGKQCIVFAARISFELKQVADLCIEITDDLLEPRNGFRKYRRGDMATPA